MKIYCKLLVMVVGVLLIGSILSCTPSEENVDSFSWVIETGSFPDVNPLNVIGDIQIAGSSTVFPLVEAVAARFNDEGYGFSVTIDSIGSGAGFERFCVAGESDISNASRPIKDEELESCRAIGREPIEMRIGIDALAIAVNPDNSWANDVTIEELALLFTAERWSDVNSFWPNQPIERFVSGTDSGTFDYFVEEVFDKDVAPILGANNTQFSEDDNILVRGIAGSTYAVGFFGYAYAENNAESLKILDIEGVTPNSDSVDAGLYPLSRPLFLYSDANIIAARPQVGAFLAYMLNYVNDEIGGVGYFPISAGDLNKTKQVLLSTLQNVGLLDS